MSTEDQPSTVAPTAAGSRAVFLSYAREDTDAARRIADALRGFGVEVWFDQTELRGGDAWDQKIRGQIKECALFAPLISARTESRGEGYFRLEWKLADERTHLMAKGMPFLVPVVVDDTGDGEAMAPDSFRAVQWTRLRGGVPTPEFVAHVKRLLEAPRRATYSAVAGVADPGPAPTRPATTLAAPLAPAKSKLPVFSAVAVAVIVLGATAFVVLRPTAKQTPAAAPVNGGGAAPLSPSLSPALSNPPAADSKSIAVLPFANFSSDPANAYFADGLHDEVITALAKIHDLKVISRTSVMAYRDVQNRNLRKIAADLGVASILEGSVQRAGNQVHLNVQLIDARTDDHIWADSYTRDVTDIFSAETDLATAVTTALKSTFSADEKSLIDRRPTTNPAAYDLYLRARVLDEQLTYASSRDECQRVVELYQRATTLDSSFLLAHVQAALLQASMYFLANIDPAPARRQAAEHEVEIAQRLAPDAPETHLARGAFDYGCNFDWTAALTAYRNAEARLPNNAQLVFRIGLAERRLGRMHDALGQFQRAADLDPNEADTVLTLIETSFALRRYADVVRLCDHYGPRLNNADPATEFLIRARYELDADRMKYLGDYAALKPPPNDENGAQTAYEQAMRVGDYRAAERALANPALKSITEEGGLFNAPLALHRAFVAWLLGDSGSARLLGQKAIVALRQSTRTVRQRQWIAMDIALAEAMAGQGDTAVREAKAALEQEIAADKYSAADFQFSYGQILIITGRNAEALEVLRGLMSEPVVEGPNELRFDPVWSRLKDDPRFKQILESAKAL